VIVGLSPLRRLQLRTYRRGDCWEWRGAKVTDGYGTIYVDGKSEMTHRLAYMVAKGSIPRGYQIDHLCRHRWCVRPSHLEAVTCRENLLRGDTTVAKSKRTHCANDHEFSGENIYVKPDGRRECRVCQQKRRRK
jgi:hypothetical protein